MQCRYCAAEVLIPDELWRRLHPVHQASRFWVRFEGPTHAVRVRQDQARQEQHQRERERQEREREAQEAVAEQDARAERARRKKPAAWIATSIFVGSSAGATALAWTETEYLSGVPEVVRSASDAMSMEAWIASIAFAFAAFVVALAL
jgi:hypothetical protein